MSRTESNPNRATLLLGLVLSLPSGALADSSPSPVTDLFVPADRVPLSRFVDPAAVPPGQQIVFVVKKDVLSALAPNSLRIAEDTSGGVVFHIPTTVDVGAGTVAISPGPVGRCVVTSNELRNDFPLVTHWDASENLGRGGQHVGGTSGIYTYHLDLNGDDPVKSVLTDPARGPVLNLGPDHNDPMTNEPYEYATDAYALFSDGSGAADSDTPGFEHYIAENWTMAALADEVAIWLSDQSRGTTGWPVAHRNYPSVLDPAAPPAQRLLPDVPAIQIVHGYIVPNPDDPNHLGREESLATFIVPPFWKAASVQRYPILFNGMYDLNAAAIAGHGPIFLKAIGHLQNEGRQAIGILWNGGGARACQTVHRSAFDNAATLLGSAEQLLGGDPHRVLMMGGSRGGTTALAMAANPYHTNYSVRFVIASNPQTRFGEALAVFNNPTYALVQAATTGASGYRNGWEDSFADSAGRSGSELAMTTYLGTSDANLVDSTLVSGAATFIDALAQSGTRVVLRVGTHDFSKSLSHVARYYEALKSSGVPVRLELSYRFGHSRARDQQPDELTLMRRIFQNDDSLETGIFHFMRRSREDNRIGLAFTPGHQPLVVEAPLGTGSHQAHTWTIVGEPGTPWEVRAALADGTPASGLTAAHPLVPFMGGVLPDDPNAELAWQVVHVQPSTATAHDDPLVFVYEVEYTDSQGGVHVVSERSLSAPLAAGNETPAFSVWNSPQHDIAEHTRTGGISSDLLFAPLGHHTP